MRVGATHFLADYIGGALYFKVRSPEHNLIHTRAQMKLLTDAEARLDMVDDRAQKIVTEVKI